MAVRIPGGSNLREKRFILAQYCGGGVHSIVAGKAWWLGQLTAVVACA